MNTEILDQAPAVKDEELGIEITNPAKPPERRRRPRAKIVQPVRVYEVTEEPAGIDEVSTSVNVSSGGICFTTSNHAFAKGMRVRITFPYLPFRDAVVKEQLSEVVRVDTHADGQFGVAIHFLNAAVEAARAARTLPPAPVARRAKGRPVVLAVDGDTRTLALLRTSLEPAGYAVVTASTGEQALDELHKIVPSVIVIELETPGFSAYDLCHIVKHDDRLQQVPLVLVTGRGSVKDYSAARDLGAVICMPKPFKADRLLQVVRLLAPQGEPVRCSVS
jgi:CheY-like chemotaxis protein